ncbi:MAG: SRPBCC family protein [Thermodesulfobacteriota bacterium]
MKRNLFKDTMKVLNIHERELEASFSKVGELIDSLASQRDRLWPIRSWPRMEFDRPLEIGARGGHGPIHYFVEDYTQGESIRFCFTGPKGFDGFHEFDIVTALDKPVVLRHTLKMNTHGLAILSWPLVIGPMHDALIEDAFATAQYSLGLTVKIQPWSPWVKILRWIFSGGKPRPQLPPGHQFKTDMQA